MARNHISLFADDILKESLLWIIDEPDAHFTTYQVAFNLSDENVTFVFSIKLI